MALEWAWLRQEDRRPTNNSDLRLSSGTGAHVFLLHGLTGSPSELAYVARRLHNDGGLRVWCPRLANHGEPLNVLAATPWRLLYEKARSDFLVARDAAERDGVPLVVGGLSLGAVLSLLLAAEFPQHVGGVMCRSDLFLRWMECSVAASAHTLHRLHAAQVLRLLPGRVALRTEGREPARACRDRLPKRPPAHERRLRAARLRPFPDTPVLREPSSDRPVRTESPAGHRAAAARAGRARRRNESSKFPARLSQRELQTEGNADARRLVSHGHRRPRARPRRRRDEPFLPRHNPSVEPSAE